MTRLAPILVLLVGCVLMAQAQDFDIDDSQSNEAVYTVKALAELPPDVQKLNTIRRLTDRLQTLPDGYSMRVAIDSFNGAGGKEMVWRYIAELTPLNPAGQPDGEAILWERRGNNHSRTINWKNGVKHGPERLYRGKTDYGENMVRVEIPWVDGVMQGDKLTYHVDGTKAGVSPYRDGVVHGDAKTWNTDGELTRVVSYEAGDRHGRQIDYWPGGEQPKQIIPYEHGQVHGLAQAFYKDGAKKWERPYVKNELHGVERHFAADGRVEKERHWDQGQEVDAP